MGTHQGDMAAGRKRERRTRGAALLLATSTLALAGLAFLAPGGSDLGAPPAGDPPAPRSLPAPQIALPDPALSFAEAEPAPAAPALPAPPAPLPKPVEPVRLNLRPIALPPAVLALAPALSEVDSAADSAPPRPLAFDPAQAARRRAALVGLRVLSPHPPDEPASAAPTELAATEETAPAPLRFESAELAARPLPPLALAAPPAAVQASEPRETAPALARARPARQPAPRPSPAAAAKVAVEQVGQAQAPSPYIAQLHEPGASLALSLAERTAQMQVPPPFDFPEQERLAMLAEAPQVLAVRVGGDTVGTVPLQLTETRAIAVQLGGLIDIMAERFDEGEFAYLRGSAGAERFVTLDELRAAGIDVRYDPVYDELRLAS